MGLHKKNSENVPRKATILYTAAMIVVYMAMYFITPGNKAVVIILCCIAFAFSGAPAPHRISRSSSLRTAKASSSAW